MYLLVEHVLIWREVPMLEAWLDAYAMSKNVHSIVLPSLASSKTGQLFKSSRLRCKQISAWIHSGNVFKTVFISIPLVFFHSWSKESCIRLASSLLIRWCLMKSSILCFISFNSSVPWYSLMMIVVTLPRMEALRKAEETNGTSMKTYRWVPTPSQHWKDGKEFFTIGVLEPIEQKVKIWLVRRITAATFPNPTEVNEVMAKNSAVIYFDFKSGPLNVSFATENEPVHILSLSCCCTMKLITHDRAFCISPLNDRATSILLEDSVVPEWQWDERCTLANVQRSRRVTSERREQQIDIRSFESSARRPSSARVEPTWNNWLSACSMPTNRRLRVICDWILTEWLPLPKKRMSHGRAPRISAAKRRQESMTKCLAIKIGLVITSFVSFSTKVVLRRTATSLSVNSDCPLLTGN